MINYTREMIDKLQRVPNTYCPNDEVLYFHLYNNDVIDFSLNTFKTHIAEHRKLGLDNTFQYKEDDNEIGLKNEFYTLVDTFKVTGVSPLYDIAFQGALNDVTGKMAVEVISKLVGRDQDRKERMELAKINNVANINTKYLDIIFERSMNVVNKGILTTTNKFNGFIGGSASGKTHDMVLYFIRELLHSPASNLLVIRKHSNTILLSIYAEYRSALEDLDLLVSSNESKKLLTISFGNDRRDQEILFRGVEKASLLDKALKGAIATDGSSFNYGHIEEISEIDEEVLDLLPTRLRGVRGLEIKVGFTSNPIRGSSWAKTKFIDNPSNYTITTSTYLNNTHLSDDYIAYMESLRDTNPLLYRQYGLGEWVSLGELIFPEDSYKIVTEVTNDWQFLGIGIDVGYVRDPSVIIKAYRRQSSEKTLDGYDYLFEECFYKSTPTPAPILHDKLLTLKDVNYDTLIYPESNPVDVAIVLQQMGFRNTTPVIKGAGSILKGLGVLTSIKPYLKGKNLIKEVQNYEWQSDGKGNHIEQPAKGQMDHGIDAMRYFVIMYKETHHHPY